MPRKMAKQTLERHAGACYAGSRPYLGPGLLGSPENRYNLPHFRVHPGNPGEIAPAIGLQIQILNPTTIGEIDAAFATLERERLDALFVAGDAFFVSRAVQFATLTARGRIPATYSGRDFVAVGGLMSYGTDFPGAFRQVGVYTGKILKGAKPADLPVVQSTKFEFVINLQTARALGLTIPPDVLSIADEVIE